MQKSKHGVLSLVVFAWIKLTGLNSYCSYTYHALSDVHQLLMVV